ncbi:hypothetical protein [Metabacillus dongyingensis]|nr:hypothetical protein [Metabacillus dongyingensis]
MKLDKSTIEKINTISLVVLAVSVAYITYRFQDFIDVLTTIGNK